MKKLCALTLLVMNLTALAKVEVIYGTDNRQEVFEATNALHKTLAKSTAGMISKSMLSKVGTVYSLLGSETLERSQNICTSEKFSQQPTAANCSGFLVGPDLLVTAGHCYESWFESQASICKNNAWVFDWDMKTISDDPTKGIPANNVYNCKEVVAQKRDNTMDFTIIRLDRKVTDRAVLKFRTAGKVADTTGLVVIGHPSGLPTKIADGGKVTRNSEVTRFSTTLDTFHGNSGSAVFDAKTGQIEGILIMGKNDYVPSIPSNPKSCQVLNKCDDQAMNCAAGVEQAPIDKGEVVLRITTITDLIKKALAKR